MILSGSMNFFTNANNTSIYGGVFTNHIQVIEGGKWSVYNLCCAITFLLALG